MTKSRHMSPRVTPKVHDWFDSNFKTVNAGAQVVIGAFPNLFEKSLTEICWVFDKRELLLLLDAHEGHTIKEEYLGQRVTLAVREACELRHRDKARSVIQEELLTKLGSLSAFHLAVLEIWATNFWVNGFIDEEKYVGDLLPDEEAA